MAMAENTGPIPGGCNMGNELIYQRKIWEPVQSDTRGNTIQFTQLIKVAGDDAKEAIMQGSGFKGNKKKFGTSDEDGDLSAHFSWWSVCIPDAEKKRLNGAKMEGNELACIYEHGSRYGENVFRMNLDDILLAYENCSTIHPEIRVLATYVYRREVMHAFVVAPEGHPTFQQHAIVAKKQASSNYYVWNTLAVLAEGESRDDYIVERNTENNTYEWKPFSIVQWRDLEAPPKQRYWAHLSFAFYLDILPNRMLTVEETADPENWTRCDLQKPSLVKALVEEDDVV